jgi:adenylylsulfate kinase
VRALIKAVSWRLLGTLGTSAIVLVFTGRWGLALSIGGVESIAKIGIYFVHERLWDRIAFGRHLVAGPRAEKPGAGEAKQDAPTP